MEWTEGSVAIGDAALFTLFSCINIAILKKDGKSKVRINSSCKSVDSFSLNDNLFDVIVLFERTELRNSCQVCTCYWMINDGDTNCFTNIRINAPKRSVMDCKIAFAKWMRFSVIDSHVCEESV